MEEAKDMLKVTKSRRHSRIVGDFGERHIANWLSRSGFEVLIIDYAAIDLLASNPQTGERMGITVKSSTLKDSLDQAGDDIVVLQGHKRTGRTVEARAEEIRGACRVFGDYNPSVAVYQEGRSRSHIYMTSLEHFMTTKVGTLGMNGWRMTWDLRGDPEQKFDSDPEVYHVHFKHWSRNWPPQSNDCLDPRLAAYPETTGPGEG